MVRMDGQRSDYLFVRGDSAIVFAYLGFEDDLEKAIVKDAAKVVAILKNEYSKIGRVRSDEKWNPNEHRHKVGHKEYLVQAVKAFQCRVYGVEGSYYGKKAFFVTVVDPKKKDDKAKPALLRKAAEEAVELVKKIEGAKL